MAQVFLAKKDYYASLIIGICFGLFSIPILQNINLPYISLGPTTYGALVIFFAIFAVVAIRIAAFLGNFLPVIFQIAKFSAIGAFNTFLDWGLLNLLIGLTGVAGGVGYSVFKGFSFLIATVGSYFWNKHWSFENGKASTGEEIGKFFVVSLVGMALNVGVASLFVSYSGLELSPERIANIGAALATLTSLVWNFLGYKFIVFKK